MRSHFRFIIACLFFVAGLLSLGRMLGNQGDEAPSVPELPALADQGDVTDNKREITLPSSRYGLNVDLAAVTHDLGEANVPAAKRTRPLQIGINRPLGISPAERGQRFQNADGTQVIVLAVRSPGAVGLRLRFTGFDIAPGDELYVRGVGEESTATGPYREKGPGAEGDFWSDTIAGDTAVIEYHVRSRVGSFVVAEVSHLYRTALQDAPEPDVLACQVDASCSSTGAKNSVGRITFIRNGGAFVCTGTLLNNSNGDRVPYFLTANHCISTQSEASSIQAYWAYQTSSCNSGVLRSDWTSTSGGATLLATSAADDSTLVRFTASVPSVASFSGWTAAAQPAGTSVFGLHHPGGGSPPSLTSFLRRSIGNIAAIAGACSLPAAYRVDWSSGTTETGSSGSGLFINGTTATHLVGVLSCGSDTGTCAGSFDYYGQFSRFYPQIAAYLSPAPTVSLATALDAPTLTWTTGGAIGWNGQTVTTHDGVDAAISGQISDNQESWVQTAVNGPGTLTFWWKVSSEPGYDFLRFRLNGVETTAAPAISGAVDWQQRSIVLPAGANTLRWTYSKDGSIAAGSDAAWLDEVTLVGPAARADFNSDNKPDLIWQNNSTGQRAIWLMNGTTYAGERFLPTVPTQWHIAGTGDFNNDGHTDIVWQNMATGQRAIWLMNGWTFAGERFLTPVPTQWEIAGTGDFNGDQQVDLIWQNTATGQRAIWLMNGTTYAGERFLPTIELEWQIAATGDFNLDAHTDIVWQNTATGQRAIWLMNGSTWVGERFLPTISREWQIAGAADFSSDGHTDIVWQNNNTGQRAVWLMNGSSWVGERFLPTVPTQWDIRNR